VSTFSRADFLFTPTAGGKPIAIYTDGWEYHRGRLATDAEQRMALQRSGRYLFWALSWDDVVEAPPTVQAPLEPNGLAVGMMPKFAKEPDIFKECWWPKSFLNSLNKSPMLQPQEAQRASSLQLLMAYLANPSEALWQGMAQQFCLAQMSALSIDDPKLLAICESLQLNPHVDEWQNPEPTQKNGQYLTPASGLKILNLVDRGRHQPERRHPAASFRAIHFEPEPSCSDQQQQATWREWLRQGNLFQFLPHLLISTPGWGGSEQPAAVDPPQVWVAAEPAKAAPEGPGAPESAAAEWKQAWQALGRFAPADVQPLLQALEAAWQGTDRPLPEQAFELEGPKGDVIAQAELAWPDQRLAVVMESVDAEAFTAAGWRCWSVEDPPAATAAALREALSPS
jgi:DEAD/DEAH box helicase domain-containing protein